MTTRVLISRNVQDSADMLPDLRVASDQYPFLREGVVLLSPRGAEGGNRTRGPGTIRKYMAQGLRTYRLLGARVIVLEDLVQFMQNTLREPGRPRKDQIGEDH